MSKKKSNNSVKNNKNSKNNIIKDSIIKENEELEKNKATEIIEEDVIIDNKEDKEDSKINNNINNINNDKENSSEDVLNSDSLFIEIDDSDDTIYDEGIENKIDNNIEKEKQEDNKNEVEDSTDDNKTKLENNNDENYISEGDIEVEKQAKSTALRVIEKKNFFILILKFVGVCIKNFFSSIYSILYTGFLKINNFFEDKAEELDRKIREIQDEQVIKNKKRELDYERYNSKRIYDDLERAEKYRNRASNRVNTEKYFEDKINEEKINNKILVRKAEEDAREAKESKEKEKSINQFNESKRRSRIEKKKNEILELRRRRKEREKLLKEEEKLKKNQSDTVNKDVSERDDNKLINKKDNHENKKENNFSGNTIKNVLKNSFNLDFRDDKDNENSKVNNESNENQNDLYDDLFKEFGNEEYFNEDEHDYDDLPNVDEIIKKADKGEKIKNVNYKEKNKDRIKEPYEKFEKENDVREIDEKLKSEILRLIDVPESETKDDFISEIDVPATYKNGDYNNINSKLEKQTSHKSYVDELMEEHSNATTIGDLLGDDDFQNENTIYINDNNNISKKNNDSNNNVNDNSKKSESDPTINIFAALRDANRKNKEKEKATSNIENKDVDKELSKKENLKNVPDEYELPKNSRVRVSKNQDGFKNIKLKSNRKDEDLYSDSNLNVGVWERKDNNPYSNSKDNKRNGNLNNNNYPYESYDKYIKNPEPEKKIENKNNTSNYSYGKHSNNNVEVRVNNDLINKTKKRNIQEQNNNNNNLNKNENEKKSKNIKEKENIEQQDKRNIRDVKGKFANLFKSQKEKSKNLSNDFDKDLYTNKFIKNIIGVEDNSNSEESRRRAEIRRESRERRENRIFSENEKDKLLENDNLSKNELTEKEEKEKYIREYLNDTSYLEGNLKLDRDTSAFDEKHNKDVEDPKVKILNVEEINKDEIVVNAYVDSDEMVYNQDENDYFYEYKENRTGEENNHRKEHRFNLKESTKKKVEERRERKISKNEEIERRSNDEYDEDKMSFGDMLKDVVSGINTSLSEIPENWKKKRESRNRIKRNQIYSTSHNRRRGRR